MNGPRKGSGPLSASLAHRAKHCLWCHRPRTANRSGRSSCDGVCALSGGSDTDAGGSQVILVHGEAGDPSHSHSAQGTGETGRASVLPLLLLVLLVLVKHREAPAGRRQKSAGW